MHDFERAEKHGAVAGAISGMITGILVANYIIFPKATGVTLTEMLQLLWKAHR